MVPGSVARIVVQRPTARHAARTSIPKPALLLMAGLLSLPSAARAQRDPYAAARRQMVDQEIAGEGITNSRVLDAMRTVPRHLFVRPDLRRMAYFDQALDIGHKQTISPPFVVAYMTETLDPQPTDKVLEIGTGSGYQAAVLSGLVAEVYTIEIVEPLGNNARRLLENLKHRNVHVKVGDGYKGWPEYAPFDKIIVTCSPEQIPQPLTEQLKEGGKMIIPLGERYQQVLYLLEKREGQLVQTKLLPTLFVPMTGTSEAQRQVQPDPAHPRLVNGGFEASTVEPGQADGWHYQRRATLVSEGAPEGKNYLRFENEDPGRGAHMLQGLGIDGRTIEAVTITLRMKLTGYRPGPESQERPGLLVHFFDARRVPIGHQDMGPWTSDLNDWTFETKTIAVPRGAQEAIVQAGLNGACGVLSLDDLRMTPHARK